MPCSLRYVSSLLCLAALAACARHASAVARNGDLEPEVRSSGGATIITANILQQQSRSLLDLMKVRVPSMQVIDDQPCPDVYLRGRSTVMTPSNPAIYVDGQRANNTCILDMVDAINLDRVEIYPSGQPKGGYLADPYGVILIFLRTAN